MAWSLSCVWHLVNNVVNFLGRGNHLPLFPFKIGRVEIILILMMMRNAVRGTTTTNAGTMMRNKMITFQFLSWAPPSLSLAVKIRGWECLAYNHTCCFMFSCMMAQWVDGPMLFYYVLLNKTPVCFPIEWSFCCCFVSIFFISFSSNKTVIYFARVWKNIF